MKVKYVKKPNQEAGEPLPPPPGPPPHEDPVPPTPPSPQPDKQPEDVDWRKLGYSNPPDEVPQVLPPDSGPQEPPLPPTTHLDPPDVVPSTLPDQGPRQLSPLHDPIEVSGESTFIHQQIKAKEQAIDWILSMLGYPLITAELNESHLNTALSNAIQTYTEYAYFPDQYILEWTCNYEDGLGFNMAKYNASSVSEIEVGRRDMCWFDWPLFTNRRGYQGSGTWAGSFITYHNLVEFREMARRLLAADYDFQYSRRTKYLTLFPPPPKPPKRELFSFPQDPPDEDQRRRGVPVVITAQIEPPLHELYGDILVRRLALAWAKIILGQVRGKFEGITLPGGGNVSKEIGAEGKEELEKLEEKIKTDRSKGQSWAFV